VQVVAEGPLDRIQVLIAEDEEAVLQALVELVSSAEDMQVVGAARDAEEAIKLAEGSCPDVALVDVRMPGGGGARTTQEIRARCPRARVVALSAYEDRSSVLEMLRAGVVGYVVKGIPADEILEIIRRSERGEGSLSTEVTAEVIHELTTLLERSEAFARELQELDRTKGELIQILSHELLTPITAIQGFASTLSEHRGELGADEMRAVASGVTQAGRRIKRLVGSLAASAHLDREDVRLPSGPVAVGHVVWETATEFDHEPGRLVLPDNPDLLARRIWADPDLAVRALATVVENAMSLSLPTEEVEIGICAREQSIEIAVLDRGPGVPEELRPRMFDAFTQADTSTTRTHQGLGIGLYLARRIMKAHAGDVEFSEREGGGSVFRLVFPSFDRQ